MTGRTGLRRYAEEASGLAIPAGAAPLSLRPPPPAGRTLVVYAASGWALGRLALAYIEPGATSFLLKLLISALVGIVVVFRHIEGMIRRLFTRFSSPDREQEPPETETGGPPAR